MEKMNPKYKKVWVDALRSGKYPQGTWAMKIEEEGYFDGGLWKEDKHTSYCCLGVAAEVCKVKGDSCGEFLTLHASKKLGLPLTVQKKLAEMNDEHKSFKYIASYIERYL